MDLGYRPILHPDAQQVIQTLPTQLRNADSVYLIRKEQLFAQLQAYVVFCTRWATKCGFVVRLIPLPYATSIIV